MTVLKRQNINKFTSEADNDAFIEELKQMIMKTLTKISILLFSAVILFSGCEKDPLQPDKRALKLIKLHGWFF